MSRRPSSLVIDARPRGPRGPLAGELVLGRPVLAHLIDLADQLGDGPISIHARDDEHGRFRSLIDELPGSGIVFVPGPPPEGAAVLRTDRLYDSARLRRALRRGRDPESAVLWRLDRPAGLAGADEELIRRRTYQPVGRYWALLPAKLLARALRDTPVRPNAVTLASASLMLGAATMVGFAGPSLAVRLGTALAMAMGLVLDTADGHLARVQGTATAFGRWLDANLDELGEMALHAAIAWSAFVRDGHPAWLVVGMAYGMGKYVFVTGVTTWESDRSAPPTRLPAMGALRGWSHWVGHADVRWHLWIVLAAVGRLDAALAAYTIYYPARALAGAIRKAGRRG